MRMMDDGLFEQVSLRRHLRDAQHARRAARAIWCSAKAPTMASSDYVTITLTAWAATARCRTARLDPIVAASSIVMALQTIVSRNVDPHATGHRHRRRAARGKANNVIPETATLELSVRALDPRSARAAGATHQGAGARPGRQLWRARGDRLSARLCGAGQHACRNRLCRGKSHWRWSDRRDRVTRPRHHRQRRLRVHAGKSARLLPADRQRRWRRAAAPSTTRATTSTTATSRSALRTGRD